MKAVDQLAIDETVVDNAELEALLEQRESKREVVSAARAAYAEVHEEAVGKFNELKLEDGAVIRVGRFRIEKRATPPRSVAFETEAKSRFVIKSGIDYSEE